MDRQIASVLRHQFDSYRYIFWEDIKGDLRSDFLEFQTMFPEIECVEVKKNEIAVKYRVLREAPEQRFLLYQAGRVSIADDWLLDMKRASYIFRADKIEIWRAELKLPAGLRPVIEDHADFFRVSKFLEQIKKNLRNSDVSATDLVRKMIAVCAGTVADLSEIIQKLLADRCAGRNTFETDLQLYNLEEALWDWFAEDLNYQPAKPSVDDFLLQFFMTCCDGVGFSGSLNSNASIYMSRWASNSLTGNDFEHLSKQCAETLQAVNAIGNFPLSDMKDKWCFEAFDIYILSHLVDSISNRQITCQEVEELVKLRRDRFWYRHNKDMARRYDACLAASRFFSELNQVNLSMATLEDAWHLYTTGYYRIDQLYRQYSACCKAGKDGNLDQLTLVVENNYNNNFLAPLAVKFQALLDKKDRIQISGVDAQRTFFTEFVEKPYLSRGNKVAVIISDGLRYEVAEELKNRIDGADRHNASITSLQGAIPTYTQLGMASLLPHKVLEMQSKGTIYADGKSTAGIENRSNILKSKCPQCKCFLYADIFGKPSSEIREIIKENDLIYIWHDAIDAAGDSNTLHGEAPNAAALAIEQIALLVKKLTSANINNLIITADHGFLYRMTPVPEEDMAEDKFPDTASVDRRYVIGTGLQSSHSSRHFNASDLGLAGDMEVVIPNGIMRFRQKGNSGRYAHGGMTLQEMVVPVISVKKVRVGTNVPVEVSLAAVNKTITTGQITVKFFQNESVSEKVKPRTLIMKFINKNEEAISDTVELTFDSTSENRRDLEKTATFRFKPNLNLKNGDNVILLMQERVGTTSTIVEYSRVTDFKYRKALIADFDDFS